MYPDQNDSDKENQKEKYLRDLEHLKNIRRKNMSQDRDEMSQDRDEETGRTESQVLPSSGSPKKQPWEEMETVSPEELDIETNYSDTEPDVQPGQVEKPGRKKGKKEPEKGKKKHHFLRNFIIIVCVLLAVFGIYTLFFNKATGDYTIAVFGVDSRNGNLGKDALSDVNMIVRINRESGEVRIVSVYRDTYVEIKKDGTYHKFNEAYFRGGPEQAIWVMENNLDIHPDDYVTFNWKAVVDAINIMGGIDIDITEPEFKYINSFITETVNSTGIGSVQLEHAGQNHLDGVQAVAYARLRLMDTDYNRTERQRRVIGLLVDKIKAANLSKRMELITSVLPETSTSMTFDDLIPFAKDAGKYYIGETTGFPFEKAGVDVGTKDCVVAVTMESNVVALHQFLFDDKNYTASESVKKISSHIIQETGLGGNGKKVDVSADDKGNSPIGPVATKAQDETQPEIPIDETTNTSQETKESTTVEEKNSETSKSSTEESSSVRETTKGNGPGVVTPKTTAEQSTQEKGPGTGTVTGSTAAESTSSQSITIPETTENKGPGNP